MSRALLIGLGLALSVSACAGAGDPVARRQEEVANDPAAMMRIGAAAEASSDYAAARVFYDRALELDDSLAAARLAEARVMARQGDVEGALGRLRDAHRDHPEDTATTAALGRLLAALHRPNEALAAFDEGLRGAAGATPLLVGRGVALDLLGRHAEAQEAYRAALAADPDNAAAKKDLDLSLGLAGAAPPKS